ncbi:MAG: metallophosphoesterase [Clostridiales bacterium]|nr:metallophosphoesterase [Clostridiales bacterium]
MKATRGRVIFWGIIVALLIISALFEIPVTEHIEIPGTPNDGSEVTAVLVTDLHSCYYGKDQESLVNMVKAAEPDIIFLGGDIFDDKLADDNTEVFLRRISELYPCFYVTGNHEYWSERQEQMCDFCESVGITVLRGDCETVTVNGRQIDICGVDDPTYMTDEAWNNQLTNAWEQTREDHYRILLSHRPERVAEYENYDFDLILSGHAHAGQFRIPFFNRGVYAPNQGFGARYINGIYELRNGSSMVVSRGLARESTPLPRFFNNPELVVLDF